MPETEETISVSQKHLFYLVLTWGEMAPKLWKIWDCSKLAKLPAFKCQKMALRAGKSKNRLQKPFWDTLKTMSTSVGKRECCKEVSKEVNQHVETSEEGGQVERWQGGWVGEGVAGVGTGHPTACNFYIERL